MATRDTSFKELTWKQKIEHIWEYYKWIIMGSIFGVCVLGYVFSVIFAPKKDVLMSAALVNVESAEAAEPDTFIRYLEEKGYNTEEETINVNTGFIIDLEYLDEATVTTYQKMTALMMVGDLDLMVGDEAMFAHLAKNGCMKDLKEVLPEETIAKYEEQGRLCWIEEPDLGYEILCGIWTEEENLLKKDGYYSGKVLVGIPYTATHVEMAKDLLLILLGE